MTISKLNKRSKATSISTFEFSTVYAKLPHNKLLMVRNNLTDFCIDEGVNKHITVYSYGVHWVKDIRCNICVLINRCLNKQQKKDAVAYLFFNSYFTVIPD